MVTSYGLSRNTGHDVMIDRENEYRRLVEITIDNQEQFISALKTGCRRYDQHYYRRTRWKHDTWLHLMGLIETWDIKNE